MRRSEITKELIELSKKAKELGFLQDVEEGDWVFIEYGLPSPMLFTQNILDKEFLDEIKEKNWFLILSFSRCLEWLAKRSWILRLPYQKDLMRKDIEFAEWFDGEFTKQEVFIKGYLFMEKPDEWIAKAVVGILGVKEDG